MQEGLYVIVASLNRALVDRDSKLNWNHAETGLFLAMQQVKSKMIVMKEIQQTCHEYAETSKNADDEDQIQRYRRLVARQW
jgi:hypothetical protein